MLRLDAGAIGRTRALIERHGLHDGVMTLPVPIRQVARDEGWTVRYAAGMHPAIAFAVILGGVKMMTVSECVSERVQRYGIAHEMAHELCRHRVSMDLYLPARERRLRPPWVMEKQEIEANCLAAWLLVPQMVLDSPFSDEWIATRCGVPEQAVAMRRLLTLEEPLALTG